MSHLAQAGSASSWEMWCDPEARERFMSVVKTAAMDAKIVAIVGRPTRRLIELLLLASQCLPFQPHLGRSTEEIGDLVATVQAMARYRGSS